ncbi:unnamed protein product [Alopecurus aequalis]
MFHSPSPGSTPPSPPPLSSTGMSTPEDPSPPWEEGGTSTLVRSSSSPSSRTTTGRLIDDLIVDILSRVPAKTLGRFKCVSKHWLSLTSDPIHRRKLPQTLAGFFYNCPSRDGHLNSFVQYTSVTRICRPLICTSLAFLPNHRHAILLDGCNGLLLVFWRPSPQGTECYYAVCNPATETWVALPDLNQDNKEDILHLALSFDPAVSSSHFHVFVLLKKRTRWEEEWDPYWCGVEVYSSETGIWVHKENGWNGDIMLTDHHSASVFLNGYMHFHAFDRESHRCLAQSQGCLHYANFKRGERGAEILLVVYVLKDYGSKKWMLKHSVEISYIFGGHPVHTNPNFDWVMIHPDCNLIFFTVGQGVTFMCYNMDRREVKMIPDTADCLAPYIYPICATVLRVTIFTLWMKQGHFLWC